MRNFIQQLLALIAYDTKILQLGGGVYSSTGSKNDFARVKFTRYPIELLPMGISQTSSAGELNLLYYFALKIVYTIRVGASPDDEGDFLELGEYLAKKLHLLRLEGLTSVLSKMMTVDSSFTLQNSNRRINVMLNDNQVAHVIFFWASEKTAAQLQASETASSSASSSSSSTPSSSSSHGNYGVSADTAAPVQETSDTTLTDILAYAAENIFP